MDYKFGYAYFDVRDGDPMTLEGRIQEALKLLRNENDCILFEDGKKCENEQVLRQTLEKGDIL